MKRGRYQSASVKLSGILIQTTGYLLPGKDGTRADILKTVPN